MSDIVNLNKFRKAKARQDKEKRAEQNRIAFGTPKAVRDADAANKALQDKKLSGKKLKTDKVDPPDTPDET